MMAAGVSVKKEALVNPCCIVWKEKCKELNEGRKCLKKAVALLTAQVDRLEPENLSLKKACDIEKANVEGEKKEKEKEVALRVSLENEVSALKSEISTLQHKGSMVAEHENGEAKNEEVKLLRDQVSEGEKEISRLKELLQIEKTKVDSEKKKAEEAKKSAVEAWKNVEAEKAKADQDRKRASTEGKKAEEYQLQLEALKKEAELAKSRLAPKTKKFEEVNKKYEAEKKKVKKEKKRADSELLKAEEQRKLAEANRKKFMEEQSHTENLSRQLEDARRRIEELQKAEEYQLQLEALKKEAAELKSRLVSETLKFEDVKKKLEAEKTMVNKERKRADSEMVNAQKQKKLTETNGKKVMEEKSRADNLSRQLEDARIKIEQLEKGITEFILSEKADGAFDVQHDEISNGKAAKIRFRDWFENLKKNSDQTKLFLEFLNYEEATKRLNVEKEKAIAEKKRADSKIVEAEKQRKLAEMNQKMAAEEKFRADQLAHQLKEDKIKIEELQKHIQDLLSSKKMVEASPVLPDKVMDVDNTKLKLLEKQVKLEKMRLKHAKEVAKMEKNRNSILQQELARLKLDFGQILFRLDVLDKYFSSSDEGPEGMEKVRDLGYMQSSKLKRKLCVEKPFHTYPNESELLKPSCTAMVASEPLGQTLQCAAPLVAPSCGNYAAFISGIDSKLESLLGGSNRKLLQTSAINSSSASFSDGQLIGSQERAVLVPTSKNLVDENFNAQPTVSSMSGKVTELRNDENLAVVAENSVRSPQNFDVNGRVYEHSRKRRILNAVKSVESLYLEGKTLHLQMEDKLSALHSVLNGQTEKPLEEAKCTDPTMEGGSCAGHERTHTKKKVSHEENATVHCLSGVDVLVKTKNSGQEILKDANAINLMGTSRPCSEGLSYHFERVPEGLMNFEELADGDYMKLLDLDNTVDEECYRSSMERPVSPTLPKIGSSGTEISDNMNKFKLLPDESFLGDLPNEKESLVPSFTSHSIDMNINSNELKGSSSGTSFAYVLPETEGPVCTFNILGSRGGTWNAMGAGKASDSHSKGSGSRLEINRLSIPSLGNDSLNSTEDKIGCEQGTIPAYCVMSSDINNPGSMSKVFFATRNCMAHCSMDIQADCSVRKILHALKMEEKILPKEKACTFFTLLLLNFSACKWGKCGSISDSDFLLCLDSFTREINSVVSDVDARNLFAEVCCLHELLGIIEEFLLDGKLMVYADPSSEPCDSTMAVLLDGMNKKFTCKSASADQLIAGCVTLASICAAIDYIEFIYQASYSLLRFRKCDNISLHAIHIFAYLAGERLFSLRKHSLTMTVLKSLIVFLERGGSSVPSAASILTMDEGGMFHPYAKCPFSTDAVPVDIVASMLLEKLQNYSVARIEHHLKESLNLSNSSVLCRKGTAKQLLSQEELHSAVDMNCVASCTLKSCVVPAQSNSIMKDTLCDLSDLLSLLELLACSMNWEWTCGQIIPQLLEMFERTQLDDLAVAVVILLGQIGRLGVSACGYEDKGVENLRCKLSGILWLDTTIRMALPVQIALSTALLGLLPLDFEKVIQTNSNLPAIGSQSVSIDRIRCWFFSLSNEQQALSHSILQSSGVA